MSPINCFRIDGIASHNGGIESQHRGDAVPRTSLDSLLAAFDTHLQTARGATQQTRREYGRYVREFLKDRSGTARINVADLGARDLIHFVAERAKHCKPATAKLVATALRSFLRFLQMRGSCDARLVAAVPTIPNWKMARVPKTLTSVQLRGLLDAFDGGTASGRRGYAMALCLALVGLRAGEVAHLTLEDIDWRASTLRIVGGKSRRDSLLPLPAAVARAIVTYLRHGRPPAITRRIFVRHMAPIGQPLTSGSVRAIIRRAFERAQVQVPSKGTHTLRHTAATRMLRAGASLKDLADVLRHRSLDTTAIYAKVDLPRLATVALPWSAVPR
jgi:site-specific recombinase XerD